MKGYSLCAGGLTLGALFFAGPAHAQSSMTLYGIVDAGLAYVNNQGGKRAVVESSGILQGSRFGFRGVEDLQGGYKALFVLENGFNVDNGTFGQGGLEFGRQAYVGLSTPGGTLTFGRQYDFLVNLFPLTNIVDGGVYAFHLGDYDRLGGERLNDAVSFRTPDFNGWQAGAMYSFGGVPGQPSTNSAFSGGLSYNSDALSLVAAYTSMNNVTVSPVNGLGVPTILGAPAGTTSLKVDRLNIAGIGASYTVGPVTAHAVYTRTDFRLAGDSDVLDAYDAGVTWYATPSVSFLLGANFYKLNGTHWEEPVLGAHKYLSKRTDLYGQLAWLRASGADAHAVLVSNAPSSNNTQLAVTMGIRHKF